MDSVIHFYFYFFLIFALSQSEGRFAELGECSQNMLSESFRNPNMLSESFRNPNIASSQFDV